MYRPTVRYHEAFRDYVDGLFQSTHLDRNQIIRAALFTAAHSPGFLRLMNENKKGDVLLPSPVWQLSDSRLWMEQNPNIEKREGDVSNVNDRGAGKIESNRFTARESDVRSETGRQQSDQGRIREVCTGGGIKIRIS